MAKGYWIANVDVTNPEGYKDYLAANAEPLKKYGAKFHIRGGSYEVVAGAGGPNRRHVVVEFDSVEKARECYFSDGYQAAAEIRDKHSMPNIIIIEGYLG
jgi:uncharacterized protein (DUF1330 family)